MSSVTIVSADRQALWDWEEAERHAEACRQDWNTMRDSFTAFDGPSRTTLTQAAINYAQAADAAHLAREKYQDMILEQMQAERDAAR